MGSVRWAFRCGSWTPTRAEWLFAARCIQPEEKDRIGQFVFTKDAKSAMAGRLLLRKFVCEKMTLPWSHFRLERSPRGKPYLPTQPQDGPVSPTWSFNVSHQGDFAVLAAQQGCQVGVDIMKTVMPGSSSVPEFFRIMTRQFTPYEWSVIQSAGSEHQQLASFYRHWALKESFIKAIGTGLGFNLQRVEFHLSSEPLTQDQPASLTTMHLDEEEQGDWLFEEMRNFNSKRLVLHPGLVHSRRPALGKAESLTGGYWETSAQEILMGARLKWPSIRVCLPQNKGDYKRRECLLDEDHHVAVALGPGSPPSPAPLAPPRAFTLLSFSELTSPASPLTDEDPSYWESFSTKAEGPQRRRDRL